MYLHTVIYLCHSIRAWSTLNGEELSLWPNHLCVKCNISRSIYFLAVEYNIKSLDRRAKLFHQVDRFILLYSLYTVCTVLLYIYIHKSCSTRKK